MENPRPEKVAVVDEVRDRFRRADGILLTEYRGLDVGEMAELRRALRAVGGDYKVYKNTLVRLAVADLEYDLGELLLGPTAIAFVVGTEDQPADAASVAKALKEYSRSHDALLLKGGVLGGRVLSADEARELADLPSREILLAQLAGALQAPMTKTARLLVALPQKFAYALQALIDDRGGAEPEPAAAVEHPSEEPVAEEPVAEEPAAEEPATEEPARAEAEPETGAVEPDTETETEES